jgi:CLIP-associating protein 1/2
MPSLLRQLAGNSSLPNQREAFFKLQKMALCAPADAPVWQVHFEHSLEAVLRGVQHADEKMRELAMACVKDLLRSQPQRFKAFTEHVLLRLLAAGRDPSRDVAVAAEEALELLLSLSDAHRCMAVLVPVVMKEGPPTLQLAVRLQSKLVPRFSQLQLLAILPQVLPPLFEAFKNPNADVRKAVVFCLVDMYMVLGEQLTPHLAVLSTSQLKLVTIYINRTAKARADRGTASPPSAASTPAVM